MRTSINIVMILLIGYLAPNTLAWTVEMDCELDGTNQLPPPVSGVTWGSLTTLSTTNIFEGQKSCRFFIEKGTEGWPSSGGALEWGSIFSLPQNVRVGQELWLRFAIYVSPTFPITTNTGALKFIRLKTRVSDKTRNTGCLDFLMGDPRKVIWDPVNKKDVSPPFIVNFEGAPNLTPVGQRPKHDVRKGSWETYEIYVKVDNIPKRQGGGGLMKIWKNNQLVDTLDNQVIVADSTGYIDALFLFTYWNGNAPSDTYALIDNLRC